jgi:hypothetical protein
VSLTLIIHLLLKLIALIIPPSGRVMSLPLPKTYPAKLMGTKFTSDMVASLILLDGSPAL